MTSREKLINNLKEKAEEIEIMPPGLVVGFAGGIFDPMIIRDVPNNKVIWDSEKLKTFVLSNPEQSRELWLQLWRRMVPEQYWFEDLTHQEFMEKKWKDWINPQW